VKSDAEIDHKHYFIDQRKMQLFTLFQIRIRLYSDNRNLNNFTTYNRLQCIPVYSRKKGKMYSCPCNRPWRFIGL
jgi:hypothetical protein